jgi:hypothetical protein
MEDAGGLDAVAVAMDARCHFGRVDQPWVLARPEHAPIARQEFAIPAPVVPLTALSALNRC